MVSIGSGDAASRRVTSSAIQVAAQHNAATIFGNAFIRLKREEMWWALLVSFTLRILNGGGHRCVAAFSAAALNRCSQPPEFAADAQTFASEEAGAQL